MSLHVEYRRDTDSATVTRGDAVEDASWLEWCRLVRDAAPGATITRVGTELFWVWFLGLTRQLRYLQQAAGFSVTYSEDALARLRTYVSEARQVAEVRDGLRTEVLDEAELRRRLHARGWDFDRRELTPEQVRDSLRMVALENGASFSVPGAGKTTVALAVHLATSPPDARLMVVAPKNAFAAWDQVLEDCLTRPYGAFRRLGQTGSRGVRHELADNPIRSVISYGQLVRAREYVRAFLDRTETHLVLDESHRIKAGDDSQTGNAALLVSHLAIRRDILSGTPMPNGVADLGPQFDFLWPAHGLGNAVRASPSPRKVVGSFYVRTTKRELGIPPAIVDYRVAAMSDAQEVLYGLLRDDVLRALARSPAGQMPRGANASVMRLLQAAVDPQAAVKSILGSQSDLTLRGDDFREVCRAVVEEDVSPRMTAVEGVARSLVASGAKALIWAPFRFTIERLAQRMADLGAVVIHGGIGLGDEADDFSREGVVRRFHQDPECRVLIANPAAGGEGISLHKVCHNAIYVGRTYNAAHFLQSRDRIHRLGLEPGTVTRLTVFEVTSARRLGSIDLAIRNRLDGKVAAMDAVFDDPDLRAISMESATADPTLDDGLTLEDLRELLTTLTTGREPNSVISAI